jgi:hypothetical protein
MFIGRTRRMNRTGSSIGGRLSRNTFELQALETRVLMSLTPLTAVRVIGPVKAPPPVPLMIAEVAYNGGVQLKITGTKGNDQIGVARTADGIVVTNTNGWTSTSYTGTYANIYVNAGLGNDRVTIDASITESTQLFGSEGNDTISGGAGPDNIYGGNGNDSLMGNAGDDVLVSLGGGALDRLTGGDGIDNFWLDYKPLTEKVTDASVEETADLTVHTIGTFRRIVQPGVNVQPSNELNNARIKDPVQTDKTYTYAPFSGRPLFSDAGPSIDDVRQGAAGDCYYLASLASVAKTNAQIIRNEIVDLGDGTYAVQFTANNGSRQYVRVDNDLPTSPYDRSRPAYAKLGAENSMWVAIMEKAFCYFRQNKGTYASIEAGLMDESYRSMGLATNTTFNGADANSTLSQIKSLLDGSWAVTTAVYDFDPSLNLVGYHSYTVDAVVTNDDGTMNLRLRNPWGVDNYTSTDGANDGYVTLTAAQAFATLPFVMTAVC